jgi:hypothetical protein
MPRCSAGTARWTVLPRHACLFLVAVLACATATLAVGCGGGGSNATAPTATAGAGTTERGAATGEPAEQIAEPFVVEGRGRTKRTIDVPADYAPLIVSAGYPEEDSHLEVQIRGEGLQRLEGESGAFLFDTGNRVTAAAGIARGRYELIVRGTKGPWSLRFETTDPARKTFSLLGRPLTAVGDLVVQVHLDRGAELEWEMQTERIFFAKLLGYGDVEGTEQLLGGVSGEGVGFAPGDRGFRSDGVMPAGDYLLVVDADGEWVIEFTAAE